LEKSTKKKSQNDSKSNLKRMQSYQTYRDAFVEKLITQENSAFDGMLKNLSERLDTMNNVIKELASQNQNTSQSKTN